MKKKICMLHFQDHTRHTIMLRELKTFLDAGYSVTVIDSEWNESSAVEYPRIQVHLIQLKFFRNIVWRLISRFTSGSIKNYYWALLGICEDIINSFRFVLPAYRCHADIYQAHDLTTLLSAVMVGNIRSKPVVYDAHEMVSDQFSSFPQYSKFLRMLEKGLLKSVQKVVLPNEQRAQVYKDEFELEIDPLIVYNCAPTKTPQKTNLLLKTLDLPPESKIVLYHGALMDGRSLEELLSAARNFSSEIILALIGEQNDYYHNRLKPIWENQNINKKVYFLPYIAPDQLLDYIASADLGVVIYKNTNRNNYLCAPTKLYEFVMMRVPIVACNFPSILDFLNEFPIGFTFSPDHPDSITEAVNTFFQLDPIQRVQINNTIERARETYNWENEGQKWLSLIEALLTD